MTALLGGGSLLVLGGEDAAAALAGIRRRLIGDEMVPYLGPDLLKLEETPPVPVLPEEVAKLLHARTPAPSRIRTNMWSVAQYIESRKHRRTLRAYMAAIFEPAARPTAVHRFLAGLPLGLIVDSWYDSTMRRALLATGREDFVDIQGITRAGINLDQWFESYDGPGACVPPERLAEARTVLYTPHGGALPAGNFLVADSDYVEVLTEIDIQTPIPDVVKDRRTTRGFVFLGCRFHDQMLRTYARQIIKRSAGPHFAVADAAGLSRNEARFFAAEGITVIDVPLAEAVTAIVGG